MKRQHGSSALLLLALLAAPAPAWGFCRATTCDPSDSTQHCEQDAEGCLLTGKPLAWRSSCVTVAVSELGSPRNGFDYDDIAGVVEEAFSAWLAADCDGGTPSIDVQLIGPVACGVSEYNQRAGNANIVLFHEDDWPYPGAENALAITRTRFDLETGELWDADIELNGTTGALSIGDPVTGDDLLSVLTHEAGHFLGLAHSPDPSATMKAIYIPELDGTEFRSLAPDDVDGICSIYPPERHAATASCENRHGFSGDCAADQAPRPDDQESGGCSVGPGGLGGAPGGRNGPAPWALLAALFTARLARRRTLV